ncbi:MAG: hypothetical protein ACXAEU_12920 [Candidatus Hodarchaeales archaeon]|jgi:hypothetical protein
MDEQAQSKSKGEKLKESDSILALVDESTATKEPEGLLKRVTRFDGQLTSTEVPVSWKKRYEKFLKFLNKQQCEMKFDNTAFFEFVTIGNILTVKVDSDELFMEANYIKAFESSYKRYLKIKKKGKEIDVDIKTTAHSWVIIERQTINRQQSTINLYDFFRLILKFNRESPAGFSAMITSGAAETNILLQQLVVGAIISE